MLVTVRHAGPRASYPYSSDKEGSRSLACESNPPTKEVQDVSSVVEKYP